VYFQIKSWMLFKGEQMNAKENSKMVMRVIVIFAALTAMGVGMAVLARGAADPLERQVLVSIGSSMFGGSLAFFLVEMFRLGGRRRE
jgi:hypothetical protein